MNNSGLEHLETMFDSNETDSKNLQYFFDTIGDFLWVMDETGNILNCNNTVYRRLGYSENELSGISLLSLHPPERRAEAMLIVQQMLTGEARYCPIPLYTKDGRYIPVETYVKPGQWNGKPALFGWSKDNSRLEISEEKFSRTFNLTNIITGISDPETGIYTDVNEEFCRALGYTRKEVIGRSSSELNIVSSEERISVFSQYDIRQGIHNVKSFFRRKDGQILQVLLSAELITILDKEYLYTTAVDITPQVKASQQVQEGIQKMDELQRIGNIGDWSLNLTTGEMMWSDQVYRIFGIEPGENPMEILNDCIHADDRASLPMGNNQLTRFDGTVYPCTEFRVIRKDSTIIFCQLRGEFTTDPAGNKLTVHGTIQDISDHKRIEIELKELNAVKDKFLTIIAHDLRNPFNTILGYTELLVDCIRHSDYTNLERYGNIIQVASERALSFLVNMLEWSRSSSGKIPYRPDTVEVRKLIIEVVSLLRYHADMKQIRIMMEVPDELSITADQNMFRTIAINLVSNAIKYSYRDGDIIISATINEGGFELSVKDNGVGMNNADISSLFTVSGKKSEIGTGNEKGTGLGLILCQDFAQRHRGKIHVESQPGKGSRFTFHIPATGRRP